ncbi:MAG: tRNA pseudouridine(55) synthase TruB [Candidatus Zixiibacteriota bacterium]|nr:MAG: tRNA pseudouridine(55) synthase TruB [candidate division Zixibacteria bacterium]
MASRTDQYHGALLIDKPAGLTSHDVVLQIRQLIKQRSVGHTGTLDPRAEGLLMVCLGRATKVIRYLADHDKTYDAGIRLGLTSSTLDAEGVDENAKPRYIPSLKPAHLESLLKEFEGTQVQRVPRFSAIRVGGRRLHELARSGEEFEPPERTVHIRHIEFLSYDKPDLFIRVTCSKGTYIRSLADEVGRRVGCGAYLAALKRTSVGPFELTDALTVSDLTDMIDRRSIEEHIIPLERLFGCAAITVKDKFSKNIVSGPMLKKKDIVKLDGSFTVGDHIVLKNTDGSILAVGKAEVDSASIGMDGQIRIFKYERVLN